MELRIRKLEIVTAISLVVGIINVGLKLWLPFGLTVPPPHPDPPLTTPEKVS